MYHVWSVFKKYFFYTIVTHQGAMLQQLYCDSPGGNAAAALSDTAFYMTYIQSPEGDKQRLWQSLHCLRALVTIIIVIILIIVIIFYHQYFIVIT